MDALLALDSRIGENLFINVQKSWWRHIASIASLLVDEAVWFTVPLVLALVHVVTAARSPQIHDGLFYGLPLSYFVDTFTDAVLISTGTSLLKLCTMRGRPAYAQQDKYHITIGDKYSFPSGHTLFAAFVARSIAGRPHTCGVYKTIAFFGVALVGWSRVAKGRHYPTDVIAGALIGALLSEIPLRGLSLEWATCKLVVAVLNFCEVMLAVAVPRLRTPGMRTGSFFLAVLFALLPFGSSPPTALMTLPAVVVLLACTRVSASAPPGLLRGLNPSSVNMKKRT